jgi:hypothetical protein
LESGVRSREREVRSQKTEVRSLESGFSSQKSATGESILGVMIESSKPGVAPTNGHGGEVGAFYNERPGGEGDL